MKETRAIMGMPVTVEIVDARATPAALQKIFDHFTRIDEKFSTYKTTSEITAINEGKLPKEQWSEEMHLIFALAEETKRATHGFFDIKTSEGRYDPSGIVKGWAIWNAAQMLKKDGFKNFYVDAGGDIQPSGVNAEGKPWTVGIKNPWNANENVKVVSVRDEGVATSGTYLRGLHIYNPRKNNEPADEIASITVIGPNIYEADRFVTAAFAMGHAGIRFIETLPGFEGYMIDKNKTATMTSGFAHYAA